MTSICLLWLSKLNESLSAGGGAVWHAEYITLGWSWFFHPSSKHNCVVLLSIHVGCRTKMMRSTERPTVASAPCLPQAKQPRTNTSVNQSAPITRTQLFSRTHFQLCSCYPWCQMRKRFSLFATVQFDWCHILCLYKVYLSHTLIKTWQKARSLTERKKNRTFESFLICPWTPPSLC